MFNLYFTDWDANGFPIPNGKKSLLKAKDTFAANVLDHNDLVNSEYFSNHYFKAMCTISNTNIKYVNNTDNSFIFVIEFSTVREYCDLLVPLSTIIPIDIVTSINKNGYLVFVDNEGLPSIHNKIIKDAIDYGVDPSRVIFISSYPIESDYNIFCNFGEENTLLKLTNNITEILDSSIEISTLYTALANVSNSQKVALINKLYDNNLQKIGTISLNHLKSRDKLLTNKNVLNDYPITLDHDHQIMVHNYGNSLKFFKKSYIGILNNPNPLFSEFCCLDYALNDDLYIISAAKRPFIVNAAVPNKLNNMKVLGYKTFNEYFDESYDLIEDTETRLDSIIGLLNSLRSTDLKKFLNNMQSTLDYNFNHFFRRYRTSHSAVNKLRKIINAN